MNSYQQQQAAETAAATDTNSMIALNIAADMGFLYIGLVQNQMYKIEDMSGRKMLLSFDSWGNDGRVIVSGEYGTAPSGRANRPGDAPRITVSKTRPADAIARDIRARFYGKFCATLADVEEGNTREAGEIATAQAVTNQIADGLKLSPSTHAEFKDVTTINTYYPEFRSGLESVGNVRVLAGSYEGDTPAVTIDHLRITVDQAIRIAEILGDE